MKQWIEYSLKCRKGQAGFALPVAIGMGLIILLVGLTMLLRSQDSQVSAIAQKDTAKSLNAAETGVHEIRALMNQHRAIANHPACESPRNTDGTCPDSGSSIESWALPNNISKILSTCGVDRKGEIINLANREWTNVDDNDPSQGEYRLLSYDEAGIATIQGRVNEGQPSESVSELQVSFPVSPAPIANLWVSTGANTSQIDPNALILGPCASGSPIQSSPLDIPGIPSPKEPLKEIDLDNTLPTELPRQKDIDDDKATADGVYQYRIDTLSSTLTVREGEKIELRVEGDITLEDPSDNITCNPSTNCSPLDVKIYGEGSSGTITLGNDIKICNVFIHAPEYTVESSGSGSPTVCESGERITGIFWVKEWGSSSSPTLNAITPQPSWTDFLSDYPPQIGPINAWETQESSSS